MKKIFVSILTVLTLVVASISYAKDVTVTWTTEAKVIPNAATATGYRVGLGVTEVTVPLTARSHTFVNVVPGTYSAWVVIIDATGKELSTPITGSGVVPPDATADVPITINIGVK